MATSTYTAISTMLTDATSSKPSRMPDVQVRIVEIKIFPLIAEPRRFVSLLAILEFSWFSNQLCLQSFGDVITKCPRGVQDGDVIS